MLNRSVILLCYSGDECWFNPAGSKLRTSTQATARNDRTEVLGGDDRTAGSFGLTLLLLSGFTAVHYENNGTTEDDRSPLSLVDRWLCLRWSRSASR